MEYVIKSKRLKEYLYCLGFDYRQVPDKTGKQEYIWLFKNTNTLKDAITYYTNTKRQLNNCL